MSLSKIDKTITAVLSQMLTDDYNIATAKSTGSRQVTIGDDDTKFKMTLRWHVADDVIDMMQHVSTWSARVRNAQGRSVMYISNMSPATSGFMGQLIRKHLESKVSDSGKNDWNDLSEYASLD
tara:strand:+ start:461 stop:829 length:369 start_codon:yes stop_codon:yes gene_type:complete